ncbi:MAG TPA: hypothetical protein VGN42_09555 [Pirellulales bacterium]|nr:hypothetical protein [Pirellulales bacterium]
MKPASLTAESPFPGGRGSMVLFLPVPFLAPAGRYKKGRFVHFSWDGDSFRIRDFIEMAEAMQSKDVTAADIWNKAIGERHKCTSALRRSVTDSQFWTDALERMTREKYEQENWRIG